MATPIKNIYVKRLTAADVRDRRFQVEKSHWSFFPLPGRTFTLEAGGETAQTHIEADECDCRPPHHQHLHFAATTIFDHLPLQRGATLTFERRAENIYSVRLSV